MSCSVQSCVTPDASNSIHTTFHQVLIHDTYITEREKPNLQHITLNKYVYDDVQKVTHSLFSVFYYFY
jgi:hypothetical protein